MKAGDADCDDYPAHVDHLARSLETILPDLATVPGGGLDLC
jgi:hypothetical protein